MYRSGTYFSAMASFWGGVAEEAAIRFRDAWKDVEKREYSPATLLSDSMRFWASTMDQYWSTILSNASTPVPVVVLEVSIGAADRNTATQAKSVAVPLGVPAPEAKALVTPLACIATDPGGQERWDIPTSHVRIEVLPGRRELEIGLVGLTELRLSTGHYWGLVYAAGTPLATVHVIATP